MFYVHMKQAYLGHVRDKDYLYVNAYSTAVSADFVISDFLGFPPSKNKYWIEISL